MYTCLESAHGVGEGALGQRTWCPHLINRCTSTVTNVASNLCHYLPLFTRRSHNEIPISARALKPRNIPPLIPRTRIENPQQPKSNIIARPPGQ
jgi:hypothetical protein